MENLAGAKRKFDASEVGSKLALQAPKPVRGLVWKETVCCVGGKVKYICKLSTTRLTFRAFVFVRVNQVPGYENSSRYQSPTRSRQT